jgi:hypothetical protein
MLIGKPCASRHVGGYVVRDATSAESEKRESDHDKKQRCRPGKVRNVENPLPLPCGPFKIV